MRPRRSLSRHARSTTSSLRAARTRRGAATLDYVLVLAVILPLVAFLFQVAPRMMNVVYEMTSVLISWPFM